MRKIYVNDGYATGHVIYYLCIYSNAYRQLLAIYKAGKKIHSLCGDRSVRQASSELTKDLTLVMSILVVLESLALLTGSTMIIGSMTFICLAIFTINIVNRLYKFKTKDLPLFVYCEAYSIKILLEDKV